MCVHSLSGNQDEPWGIEMMLKWRLRDKIGLAVEIVYEIAKAIPVQKLQQFAESLWTCGPAVIFQDQVSDIS